MSTHLAEAPLSPERRSCPYRLPDSYKTIGTRGPVNQVTRWDGRRVWLLYRLVERPLVRQWSSPRLPRPGQPSPNRQNPGVAVTVAVQ
ncbi:hypothetical protein FDG2_2964 [Candidatus Protofrankia californiensis]|uniref:Uncharacterized protein n=1 Tax=Candidatus Protofrankia californiensis TaxID=1839754 RepID=A0A1C3NYM9_9ACTN|nr:hypothetical protein FDG2_2964 [Candidatus Protofrankia californiensis]